MMSAWRQMDEGVELPGTAMTIEDSDLDWQVWTRDRQHGDWQRMIRG